VACGNVVPLQSFLLTSLYQGHVIQATPDLDTATAQALLKRSCSLTLAQAVKAALQVAYTPALLLMCGAAHIIMSVPSPLAGVDGDAAARWDAQPSLLSVTITGFLGWWACLVTALWASVGVMVAHLATGPSAGS
jgi:hypothetical protein